MSNIFLILYSYPAGQTEVQGPSHVQKFSQNLPSKTHTMPQQRINNIVGSPSATSRQSFFSSSSDNDSSLGLNPHETVTFSIGDLQITKVKFVNFINLARIDSSNPTFRLVNFKISFTLLIIANFTEA